jgi:DNA (cytosine-5)-methyltransferase 1
MCNKITKFNPYTLKEVNQNSSKNKFTVVTTFAGGGGSSTGYRLAGGKILLANEFIPAAVDTYKSNYPDTPVEMIDIRKITRGKYVNEWFESYGIQKGEYDILDGSPPCSTFSTSGKGKKKIEEKNVKYSDTTQDRIGMLIHDFVYIANCTQPKVVIIENVPSIQSSDVFQYALERLRRYNYLVNYSVLTSSNFGVPQKRKRLFVIGIRPDIAKKVGITDERDILDIYPKGSSYEPTIKDAFEGLTINEKEREMLLSNCRRSSSYELIKRLPKNPTKSMKISNIDPNWISDFNLVRPSINKPCPTLTQMGQQMGRGGVLHPNEDRVFTVNEMIRLMGLPDDFKLTGNFNQKIERMGRMVPPLMTKALSEAIYEKILK